MTTQDMLFGPFKEEIRSFIAFKRESGSVYTTAAFALSAFDRFCAMPKSKDHSLQQLAEAWVIPGDDKPRYDEGACIRQLGQYLTEIGHPHAFTLLSGRGNRPRLIGVSDGPFGAEIEDFINHKRSAGRKYIAAEYSLRAFDKFCSMSTNELSGPQQLAEAWWDSRGEDGGFDISAIREFGLYLSTQNSKKSFMLPYADGSMPRPAFVGYECLYANEIDSFLTAMRAAGLKYRHEAICLKDFDRFCRLQPDLPLQQMADDFICSQKGLSLEKGKRSTTVMRALGNYLTEDGHPDAFTIPDRYFVAGPYREEISAFVAFKRSCGFKYKASAYQLKCFDAFCSAEENKGLSSQQLADKWVLKKGDEHPNTRSGRVGPARVFGKYLTGIGHPMAFSIADDVARGGMAKPPYLFDEDDIGLFFNACAELSLDESDPSAHIVLPAAFLFMHCLGVRTGELKV